MNSNIFLFSNNFLFVSEIISWFDLLIISCLLGRIDNISSENCLIKLLHPNFLLFDSKSLLIGYEIKRLNSEFESIKWGLCFISFTLSFLSNNLFSKILNKSCILLLLFLFLFSLFLSFSSISLISSDSLLVNFFNSSSFAFFSLSLFSFFFFFSNFFLKIISFSSIFFEYISYNSVSLSDSVNSSFNNFNSSKSILFKKL